MTDKTTQTKKGAAAAVLEQITRGAVVQTPRWHFVARNSALWIAGILFVFFGALFVALMIFVILNEPWGMGRFFGATSFAHMAVLVPLLWACSFGVFVSVGEFFIRHTRRAYRFSVWQMTGALFGVSIVLGVALYAFGAAHRAEHLLEGRVPFYHSVEERRDALFNDPAQGRIMGRVAEVGADNIIVVNMRTQEQWFVAFNHMPVAKAAQVRVGQEVVFFGRDIGDALFDACDSVVLPRRGFIENLPRAERDRIITDVRARGDVPLSGMRTRGAYDAEGSDDQSDMLQQKQTQRRSGTPRDAALSPTCVEVMDSDVYAELSARMER